MSARILFICSGNIARSQMAEGLARSLVKPGVEVASAGTHPNPRAVHPLALRVLSEHGINGSLQHSKHVSSLTGEFDYVITLCDAAARDCPLLPARRERLHWSIPDPGLAGADPEAVLDTFRDIGNDIEQRLRSWLALRGLLRDGA
jgi:arsenate reductase (thioredoxin)